jgi:aspartyl-tRNA(Asn)/glutamyl-tRNA(Gln) amidotransferase subunit C
MSAALSRTEVLRIAALARLELTPEETELFAGQLARILEYVEQIRDLDTTGVPPTSHVMNQPIDREDRPQPSLTRDDALGNAPDAARQSGLFKVPRVFA